MGIKGLNNLLRKECKDIFVLKHLSEFAFQKMAIDISLYLCKFKVIAGENWLLLFVNLVACLRRNQIHPIFIFDGDSPNEKGDEKLKRAAEKKKLETKVIELEKSLEYYFKTGNLNTNLLDLYSRRRSPIRKKRLLLVTPQKDQVNIDWIVNKVKQKRNQIISHTPEDFVLAKELFDLLKVPYVQAPFEAEKCCSKLCLDGIVDVVLSEDTDIIAYQCPIFLSKIDTRKDTVICVENKQLLNRLDITSNQLLDLCIMCGTDYNKNIPKIGPITSFKKIKQYSSILLFSEAEDINIEILNYKAVKKLFTEFEDYKIRKIEYCGHPDFESLRKFLLQKKVWSNSYFDLSFSKIKKDLLFKQICFED